MQLLQCLAQGGLADAVSFGQVVAVKGRVGAQIKVDDPLPQVFVEPLNRAPVLALLQELQQETGMGLLLITPDLPVVRDFADRVIVMKSGKIVEERPTGQIFDAPRRPYTRALLAASLDPDPVVQAARRAARPSEGLVPA